MLRHPLQRSVVLLSHMSPMSASISARRCTCAQRAMRRAWAVDGTGRPSRRASAMNHSVSCGTGGNGFGSELWRDTMAVRGATGHPTARAANFSDTAQFVGSWALGASTYGMVAFARIDRLDEACRTNLPRLGLMFGAV